jgi:hypothetical protein
MNYSLDTQAATENADSDIMLVDQPERISRYAPVHVRYVPSQSTVFDRQLKFKLVTSTEGAPEKPEAVRDEATLIEYVSCLYKYDYAGAHSSKKVYRLGHDKSYIEDLHRNTNTNEYNGYRAYTKINWVVAKQIDERVS